MIGSYGGLLKNTIIIQAIDMASGMINNIRNSLLDLQKIQNMPTQGTAFIPSLVSDYAKLLQLEQQLEATPLMQGKDTYSQIANAQKAEATGIVQADKKILENRLQMYKTLFDPAEEGESAAKYYDRIGKIINRELKGLGAEQGMVKKIGEFGKEYFPPTATKNIENIMAAYRQAQRSIVSDFASTEKGMRRADDVSTTNHKKRITELKERSEVAGQALNKLQKQVLGFSQSDRIIAQNWQDISADMLEFEQKKAEAAGVGEELQYWTTELVNTKQQLKGISVLMTEVLRNVSMVVQETKAFRLAEVFGMTQFGGAPFGMAQMGASLQQVGTTLQTIERSPFRRELENISPKLLQYGQIFGQSANEIVPVLTGLKLVSGEASDFNDILGKMTVLSAQTGEEFGRWFSIMMMQGVPAMSMMGSNLDEIMGIIGGVNIAGLGPFAGIGVSALVKSILAPTDQMREDWQSMGINIDKLASKGLVKALEQIKTMTDTMSEFEKGQFFEKMFPGFGTGVSLILTKALPQIKQVTQQVGSSYEAWRINAEALNMPISKIAEATQLTHNIWMQFIDSILRSSSAVAFIETLLDAIKGIQSALSWLEQKVPVVFNVIFVCGLIAAGAVVVNLTKKLFAQIGAVLSLSASLKELNTQLSLMSWNMAVATGAQTGLNLAMAGGATNTALKGIQGAGMMQMANGMLIKPTTAVTGAGAGSILGKVAGGISKAVPYIAIIAGAITVIKSIDNHLQKMRAEQINAVTKLTAKTRQFPNITTRYQLVQYEAAREAEKAEFKKQYPEVAKRIEETDFVVDVVVTPKPRTTFKKAVKP